MSVILQKLPLFVELVFNGLFMLIYLLTSKGAGALSIYHGVGKYAVMVGTYGAPVVLLFVVVGHYLTVDSLEEFLRKHTFSLIVFCPLVITLGDSDFAFWLCCAHLAFTLFSLYDGGKSYKKIYDPLAMRRKVSLSPAQIVSFSFLMIILIGTFLLMLPVSSNEGKSVSFIDALFTATSATCVTGLSSFSIPQVLSFFGQIVILALVQIGGLGYMTLFSCMSIFMGKSIGVKDRLLMDNVLEVGNFEELMEMIVDIVRYTFIIELWGAIVLTVAFTLEGMDFSRAIYFGVFHSISAFCNAGFALFDDNLESFATNPLAHGTVAILITLGGLGFAVLKELKDLTARKKGLRRLSIHSKVVLITSAILTLSGATIIFFSEYLHALDGYSLWGKIQVAMFQSVTLRTAGFNTIPLGTLQAHTCYVMILYMFIGASPGSTGGGIKTTTFAILFQSLRATLRGRRNVKVFDRNINNATVVKATAISILSVLLTSCFIFVLMKVEKNQTFLTITYEAISAFGTVGLTLGITSYLTPLGKFLIALLMFIGRVGPLTLILALGESTDSEGRYEYPDGKIMIG